MAKTPSISRREDTRWVAVCRKDYFGPRSEYTLLAVCDTLADAQRVVADIMRPNEPLCLGHNQYGADWLVLPVWHASDCSPSDDWGLMPREIEDRACEICPSGDDPDGAAVERAIGECGYVLLWDEVGREYLYCRKDNPAA